MKPRRIKKILVVYKSSIYQRYVLERKQASVLKLVRKKHKIASNLNSHNHFKRAYSTFNLYLIPKMKRMQTLNSINKE